MAVKPSTVSAGNLEFETLTLKNGLTVNLLQRPTIPVITMNMKVGAGIIVEKENEEGVANITSELLEMGTEKFSAEKLSDEIDFMGAAFDAGVSRDATDMDFEALSKDLERAIEFYSQIIVHPTFPAKEISKKKEEIVADLIRQREKPGTIARNAFKREVYKKHPYSHPVEGTVEGVKKITKKQITDFYKRNYIPNNSYLSIVGKFDKEELIGLLEKYFGGWKAGKKPELPPKPKKLAKSSVKIIPMEITQANIIFGHLGAERANPDYFKIKVMNYILGGGGFSSRMLKDLRDEKGLTYGIYSSFAFGVEEGTFTVSIQTKNKSAYEALKGILRHMKAMREKQVSEQEYNEALSYLTGSYFLRLDTNRKMADVLGSISFYNLGSDYLNTYIDKLKAVTRKDILEVAQKYLDSEKYKIVVVGNDKELDKDGILKDFQ